MKNNRFTYLVLSVLALLILGSSAFVAMSTPALELPVVENIYNAEHEGVGQTFALDLKGNQTWNFHATLGDAPVASGYGLPIGVYYLHVSTGPNIGWGIDPRDSEVTIKHLEDGWYKVIVKNKNNQYPVLYFYRTYPQPKQ